MKTTTILTGLLTALFGTSTSSAVDFFFNVANGDWNAAGSWTPAGPPQGRRQGTGVLSVSNGAFNQLNHGTQLIVGEEVREH
jgi:hypothetical protein